MAPALLVLSAIDSTLESFQQSNYDKQHAYKIRVRSDEHAEQRQFKMQR
jgi:hypothetical protein